MKEKKEIKRIKENITELEYKKLMSFVRGNENLRENTKLNFHWLNKKLPQIEAETIKLTN